MGLRVWWNAGQEIRKRNTGDRRTKCVWGLEKYAPGVRVNQPKLCIYENALFKHVTLYDNKKLKHIMHINCKWWKSEIFDDKSLKFHSCIQVWDDCFNNQIQKEMPVRVWTCHYVPAVRLYFIHEFLNNDFFKLKNCKYIVLKLVCLVSFPY